MQHCHLVRGHCSQLAAAFRSHITRQLPQVYLVPRGNSQQQPGHQQQWRRRCSAATCPQPQVAEEQVEVAPEPCPPPSPNLQQQQKQQMYCLVKNDEILPCLQASGPWLEASPRGAYTTARTVGGTSVFELTFHIERLASSARLMMDSDVAATNAAAGSGAAEPATGKQEQLQPPSQQLSAAAATDPAQLRPRVVSAMRAAVQGYRAASGDASGELKLTVLLTWTGCQQHVAPGSNHNNNGSNGSNGSGTGDGGSSSADVYVHVSPLPPRPAPPVKVQMRGAPRENAAAKDSEWVRKRKALEREAPPGVNEVVLVGERGALYEGLTSNFFAVMDGAVYTAGEGILAGTVREVALAVAKREGIPVVLEPPRLADLARWEGCFISSTSRLLLPVDQVLVPEEQGEEEGEAPPPVSSRTFERGGLVQRLEQLVLAEIAACSEALF